MTETSEWVEMINQEIKEIQRLLDRKAEQKQIAKFQAAYTKKKKVSFGQGLQLEDIKILEESSELLSKDENTDKDANSESSDEKRRKVHKFGTDISSDFTTLFGAFNRVAKQKLDNAILSDFYSVSLVDSIYEKRSTQFSAQVTESCQLYYQLFDEKITNLSNKIAMFHQTIVHRLDEIDFVTKALQTRLKRIYINRRHIGNKDEDEDESAESKSGNMTAHMSARLSGRLSARLPDSMNSKTRRQHSPFSFQKMSDFSHTAQPTITPLYPQDDDNDEN